LTGFSGVSGSCGGSSVSGVSVSVS
jgi:hypothetical protein